jgi:ligand-binding sensor domain-containing protein/signal transduction histidine kinase
MGAMHRAIGVLTLCLLVWGSHPGWAKPLRLDALPPGESADALDTLGTLQDILQDDTGFIWLAGDNGLGRFDSHQLHIFQEDARQPQGLQGNNVRALAKDNSGQLWVGTGKGLHYWDIRSGSLVHWRPEAPVSGLAEPLGDINDLWVDADNTLWVAAQAGLLALDAARKHLILYPLPSGRRVQTLFYSPTGALWLGLAEGGMARFHLKQRQFDGWRPDPTLAAADVRSLTADHLGNLWAASLNAGIFELSPSGALLRHHRPDGQPGSLPEAAIWKLHLDHDFNLWVLTDRHGLWGWDSVQKRFFAYSPVYSLAKPLDVQQVRALYEDSLGDLWLGLAPRGLALHNRALQAFRHHQQRPEPGSLGNSRILSLLRDRTQDLWVGTEQGLYRLDTQTQQFSAFQHRPSQPGSLCHDAVLSLAADADRGLWVGTWGAGLCYWNRSSQQFTRINGPDSPQSPYIWGLLQDVQGDLWVSTEGAGLYRYQAALQRWQHFASDPHNPASPASATLGPLVQTRNGDVWFGTSEGLNRFERATGTISRLTSELPALQGQRVRALWEDDWGRLWIGTHNQGLWIYNPVDGSQQVVRREEGLPSNTVASLTEDEQGNIWAATPSGLARIDTTNFWVNSLQKTQGLGSQDFNRQASSCFSGRCYFGSGEGLIEFRPDEWVLQRRPPNLAITAVSINGKAQALAPAYQLDGPVERLNITFAALSYRGLGQNRYAYQLEGFDSQWQEVGTLNQALYTHLPPGHYTFVLRGANHQGDWNLAGPSLQLHIAPPVWLRWPLLVLYGFFGLALLGGLAALLWRCRHLVIKTRQQARQLREEQDNARYFLAALSDLREPLGGISGLAEGVSHGLYGPVHPMVKQAAGRMQADAARLVARVNNMASFGLLLNRQLVFRPKPLLLNPLVDDIFTLLQPLLHNKPLKLINGLREPISLVADPQALHQVLFNLIGNGINYSQEGYVMVMATVKDNRAYIWVEDTGAGIPAERLEVISAAFSPVGQARAELNPRLGLSLSVSQVLVQLMGGTMQVDSKPSVGTRFTFNLLVAQPEALYMPLPEKRQGPVVLVDEDPSSRRHLAEMLQKLGCQVEELSSLEALREQVDKHGERMGAVMINLCIKSMQGYQLVHQLRAQSRSRYLPLILLTPAWSEDLPLSQEQDQDAFLDYLALPADPEALAAVCQKYLQPPPHSTS